MTMIKRQRLFTMLTSAVLGLGLLSAGPASAQPLNLTTTGGSAQGFIRVTVEAFHAIVRDAVPGSSATFRPSSVAGGMLDTAEGRADIAFAIPPVELRRGLAGEDPFQKPMKGQLLALMTFVDNLEFYIVADAGWARRNGITTMADIAAKRPRINLNLNERGTFYAIAAAEELFKAHGFGLAEIQRWGGSVVYSPSAAQIDNLRDGKVDLVINASFAPDGRLLDLSRTKELAWIAPSAEALQKAATILDMRVGQTSKVHYPFLQADQPTLVANLTMAAGRHVGDEAAYTFVKAIAGNLDRVQAIHPALKGFSTGIMLAKPDSIEWHPGALRYFKEVGLVK